MQSKRASVEVFYSYVHEKDWLFTHHPQTALTYEEGARSCFLCDNREVVEHIL